jgi:glycosyltransferase involved in cell wall biosynthesis
MSHDLLNQPSIIPSLPSRRNDPWLSILIPVYNVAPYLAECMSSIGLQFVEGIEVILLDDCSTDGSRDLCEQLCRNMGPAYRFMKHDRNRGISAARNSMIELARGRYIWFVDSDDELLEGSLSHLKAIVDAHSPDLIVCDYHKKGRRCSSFVGPSGRLIAEQDPIVRGVFASRRMHSWSKVSRRSLWGADLRFPVGRCFEDMTITPFLLLRARSLFYANAAWVRYRVRPGSITGITSRSPGQFDDAKNRDVATALEGFVSAARQAIPDLTEETLFYIERYLTKEFTKICWRLVSARFGREPWAEIRTVATRFRSMMEACAPKPFATLGPSYMRRGQLGRWFVLTLCLMATRGATGSLTTEAHAH